MKKDEEFAKELYYVIDEGVKDLTELCLFLAVLLVYKIMLTGTILPFDLMLMRMSFLVPFLVLYFIVSIAMRTPNNAEDLAMCVLSRLTRVVLFLGILLGII